MSSVSSPAYVPRRLGPKNPLTFVYTLFHSVLPQSKRELSYWTEFAGRIPDAQLRLQAMSSLRDKRFHADGGSVFAAAAPHHQESLIRFIVSLQTISDYLDNLCDRCGRVDEADFVQLHRAMQDAVDPEKPLHDYYLYRSNSQDGGYLNHLVQTCRQQVQQLPGYQVVTPHIVWLVERYCELQAYKHIHPDVREQRLQDWWQTYAKQFPDLFWWEFAAATGSTLGVFALATAAASEVDEATADEICRAYFPWVGGLHILLDYLIDQEEDQLHGDLNFVSFYTDATQASQRLRKFVRESLRRTRTLPDKRRIHQDTVRGVLAVYLSDEKVAAQPQVRPTRRLVWQFGPTTLLYYAACRHYRASYKTRSPG